MNMNETQETLEHKVSQSIKLIQSTCKERGIVEVAYSGGKDSDVILQLVKESGIPYRAIYKNTTIDPPGTIAHVKEMGVEVVTPDKTFFQLIKEYGFPNRFSRFCCAYLKEYKILDTVIIGVRKAESAKRKKIYTEPTECRIYKKRANVRQYRIYPILYWTDEDVENFIIDRKIQCHPLYYDDKGKFHVERRLGCMGCPLVSRKKRLVFFKKNPKWLAAWINAFTKKRSKEECFEHLARDLFYDNQNKYFEDKNGLFPLSCEDSIKTYFNL